jgi:hypothetical protein
MTFPRRRRLLRLHLEGNRPSVEGVFLGFEAGHYRLANAKLLKTAEQTIELDGETWVPRERVLHGQVLG